MASGSGHAGISPYFQTDGHWERVWALYKATSAASGCDTRLEAGFDNTHPMNAYAPMFVRIPASSIAVVAAPAFSSASESGNSVTFTTSAAHNFSLGQPIVISGCSISGYNGEFVVSGTPTSSTFTVWNSATGLGAPSGCVITPGNDSEATDWAINTPSYGDNCNVGYICGIRAQFGVIVKGTSTLTISAIASGACASVVTTSAAGALTSDSIKWAYASAPATADGLLQLSAYPTANNVNFKLCNPTGSSQTPSGLVVNWEVVR